VGRIQIVRTQSVRAAAAAWGPQALSPVTVTAVLIAAYLVWLPTAPDLSAQIARATVAGTRGNVSWWTGWFGGFSLTSYSLFVPAWMATLGVRTTAVIAVVAAMAAGTILTRDTARPRAGAVAIAIAVFADALAGRVTFAVGLAFAMWALVAVRSRRSVLASALALCTALATPLAGLFLGMILVAVVIVDASRRRTALAAAVVLAVLAVALVLLLPGAGRMPFTATGLVPPALGCAVVLIVRPPRIVVVTTLVTIGALLLFFLVPSAVGSNVARMVWLCSAPTIVACGRLPRRQLLALATAVAAVWPMTDIVEQVKWSSPPSADASYYQPLLTELKNERQLAGPAAAGQRVEVVDTVDHGASAFVAPSIAIARGWDRPTDRSANPIFYRHGALTPDSYHRWLRDMAVTWVAVPAARLDMAARAEAQLISSGLPYLHATWRTPDWTLYQLVDPQPLVLGARVDSVTADSITMTAVARTDVLVRVRWSPYLRAVTAVGSDLVASCVVDSHGWTRVHVAQPGLLTLTSRFDIVGRLLRAHAGC
jgi:hypothetical protein